MKLRGKLKWGLGGLAALVLAGCFCNPQIKRLIIPERPALVVNLEEQNKRKLYNLALKNLDEYFRGDGNSQGYVDFMTPYSRELRANLNAKGEEEVIKGYVEVHKKCLDLAVFRLNREISDEDISELADKLVIHMRDNAKIVDEKEGKGVIDYEHPAVKQGYGAFGENRAKYFQRIFRANISNPPDSFNEAIRQAYPKEFKEESAKYAEARKKLYGSFAKSTENFRSNIPFWAAIIRAIAPAIAEKVRKASEVYNARKEKEVYK